MVFLDMYNCMVRRITLAYDYSYNVLYYPMETSRIYKLSVLKK